MGRNWRRAGAWKGSDGEGGELRAARERAGWSLEEVSRKTRIPLQHLRALEAGELHRLPSGPYRKGYIRQYRMLLGLSRDRIPHPEETDPAPAPEEVVVDQVEASTRQVIRGAVLGGLVLALLVLLGRLGERLTQQEETIGETPDQVLELRPTDRVRLQVVADDRLIFEGVIEPGSKEAEGRTRYCQPGCRFSAHDRLEVAVSNLSLVEMFYNGRPLKPLGAQSRARRLVFIDDAADH